VIENAQAKLVTKQCDLIVANDVSEPGSGFAVDTNHVQLVDKAGVTDVPAGAKAEVAHRILDKIVSLRAAGSPARAAKAPKLVAAKSAKKRR
jgi:phosphopantothenoylcysteine decarboxylase/phosphopantothenate--cysteine ligase